MKIIYVNIPHSKRKDEWALGKIIDLYSSYITCIVWELLHKKGTKEDIEEEVRAKEAEIVEFAELGEFIDMPVRTYSSGMYSKLAFSITAILETDIMLIDEVLSVGDQKFKKKSYNKMKSLISNKERTVIIVSHSIETLQELCDTVMWMHDGQIKRIGEPKPVLEEYVDFMEKN